MGCKRADDDGLYDFIDCLVFICHVEFVDEFDNIVSYLHTQSPEAFQTMLDAGMNVNASTLFGQNALFSTKSRLKFEQLIDAGVDVFKADRRCGNTVMHCITDFDAMIALIDHLRGLGGTALEDMLGKKNKNGETALHVHVYECRAKIVNELVKAGADVHARNDPPVLCERLLEECLQNGIIAEGLDNNNIKAIVQTFAYAPNGHQLRPIASLLLCHAGRTPLHKAPCATIAKILLDGGASPHALDAFGMTPIENAQARFRLASAWKRMGWACNPTGFMDFEKLQAVLHDAAAVTMNPHAKVFRPGMA